MLQVEKPHNLIHREGRGRLLAVAEGCVGQPDLPCRLHGHNPVVKGRLGDRFIVEQMAEEVRLRHILQGETRGPLLQQIGLMVKMQDRLEIHVFLIAHALPSLC